MHFDFEASSRENRFVLYDPTLVPLDFPSDPDLKKPEPNPPSPKSVDELAATGSAFVVQVDSEDCEAKVRVFVDEEPPADLMARRNPDRAIQGALLRAPTGNLIADGIEFIRRGGIRRDEGSSKEFSIPSGDYVLDAFDLMGWKIKHRKEEIARCTSRVARWCRVASSAFTIAGVALFVAHFSVIPLALVVIGFWRGRRTAFVIGAWILAFDALVLFMFWLLERMQRHFPVLDAAYVAEKAFDQENPDVVVVLKRITEKPFTHNFHPAKLQISF